MIVSVVHEVAGHTSNSLSKHSTYGNSPLTSRIMFCMTVCACYNELYSFCCENVANCEDGVYMHSTRDTVYKYLDLLQPKVTWLLVFSMSASQPILC